VLIIKRKRKKITGSRRVSIRSFRESQACPLARLERPASPAVAFVSALFLTTGKMLGWWGMLGFVLGFTRTAISQRA
jgi:hypothetical protein